jgi:hypothetical protein
VTGAFQRNGLRKAAAVLGGEVHLRRYLNVPSTDLFRWLRGQAPIPDEVFRKVVDLLAKAEAGTLAPPEGATPKEHPEHPTPSR